MTRTDFFLLAWRTYDPGPFAADADLQVGNRPFVNGRRQAVDHQVILDFRGQVKDVAIGSLWAMTASLCEPAGMSS